MKMASCHPDMPLKARGLCSKCYGRHLYNGTLPAIQPRAKAQNTCGHPDKKHVGKGLCSTCYPSMLRQRDPAGEKIKRREWQLSKLYGLSIPEFDALWIKQGEACALCVKPVPEERHRHVDHCHESGRIRGILCAGCNKALGVLGDTPESLMRAYEYVAKAGVFVPLERAA